MNCKRLWVQKNAHLALGRRSMGMKQESSAWVLVDRNAATFGQLWLVLRCFQNLAEKLFCYLAIPLST